MKMTQCMLQIARAAIGATILLVALCTTPPAQSQIVPVNLNHETPPDSHIPSAIVLRPLLRREPRKPVEDHHLRLFVVMAAGVYTASALDMHQSKSHIS
jgi:hypothetical protein